MRTEEDIKSALFSWRAIASASDLPLDIDPATAQEWDLSRSHALHASQTLDWVLEGSSPHPVPSMAVMRDRLRRWPGKWEDIMCDANAERSLLAFIMGEGGIEENHMTLTNAEDAIADLIWSAEDVLAASTVAGLAHALIALANSYPQLATWHSKYNENTGTLPREGDEDE